MRSAVGLLGIPRESLPLPLFMPKTADRSAVFLSCYGFVEPVLDGRIDGVPLGLLHFPFFFEPCH